MGASCLGVLLFLVGVMRRSYLALAVPAGIGVGLASALGFWVGYTMATTKWEDADFQDYEVPAAEGAPPPEAVLQA
jgi:hypothetical protein